MLRKLNISVVIAAFSLAGCLGGGSGSGSGSGTGTGTGDGTGTSTPGGSLGLSGGGTAGSGDGDTFNHDGDGLGPEADPFAVLQRIQEEGPPEISTRMHSCQKMKYATVGNVLTNFGVNMAATATTSAGFLYKNGSQAMGAPIYASRTAEAIALSTAGATKLFDIFVQASPEIVTALPTKAMKGGAAIALYDSSGKVTADAIAWLQGAPATQAQMDLYNNVKTSASTPAIGETLAVASLLAAAHTCE
ncbi:MAG TPA: hypothetical protein VGL86_13970 [Polyangia bacterium]|jgi:hypothetical protein